MKFHEQPHMLHPLHSGRPVLLCIHVQLDSHQVEVLCKCARRFWRGEPGTACPPDGDSPAARQRDPAARTKERRRITFGDSFLANGPLWREWTRGSGSADTEAAQDVKWARRSRDAAFPAPALSGSTTNELPDAVRYSLRLIPFHPQ